MILSPNDICLRPITTPHPDNISTGIMSGRISSAPVRWAGDKFGKWDRWNYTACMTSWVITCKMKPGRNVGSLCLFHSAAEEWSHTRSTQGILVLQVSLTEQYPVSKIHFGFDRSRPWLEENITACVPACQPVCFLFLCNTFIKQFGCLQALFIYAFFQDHQLNMTCHPLTYSWIQVKPYNTS